MVNKKNQNFFDKLLIEEELVIKKNNNGEFNIKIDGIFFSKKITENFLMISVDLFSMCLIFNYILNQAKKLSGIGLDLYSLIKLTFSSFVIFAFFSSFIDLFTRIINIASYLTKKAELIDSYQSKTDSIQSKTDSKVSIFRGSVEIVFYELLPLLENLIVGFYKNLSVFLDSKIITPGARSINSLKENLGNINLQAKFDHFDTKIKGVTKEFAEHWNNFKKYSKEKLEIVFDFVKGIFNWIVQNILIEIAEFFSQFIEKNFDIKHSNKKYHELNGAASFPERLTDKLINQKMKKEGRGQKFAVYKTWHFKKHSSKSINVFVPKFNYFFYKECQKFKINNNFILDILNSIFVFLDNFIQNNKEKCKNEVPKKLEVGDVFVIPREHGYSDETNYIGFHYCL